MPIYECHCEPCRITFEIFAPVNEANRTRPCPRCARPARRVVSAFAIGNAKVAADSASADSFISPPRGPRHSHASHAPDENSSRGRAGRPTLPDFARLCWMDDRSAERFAAYKLGRGAEYDDKSAVREDLRRKRGLPAEPPADQSHSPVAQMVARKKGEQAKKAAKMIKLGPSDAPQQ
jgi:putative FmdB family regulatory protein